jgi:hypothetical protein
MPMNTSRTRSEDRRKSRVDGRRAIFLYLPPDVIKALKKAAVDEDRHSYEIAEEAILRWLRDRDGKVADVASGSGINQGGSD